jgi:hypothetical protein
MSVLRLWSRLTRPSISDGNSSGDFPTNNQYLLHFSNDLFVNDCKNSPWTGRPGNICNSSLRYRYIVSPIIFSYLWSLKRKRFSSSPDTRYIVPEWERNCRQRNSSGAMLKRCRSRNTWYSEYNRPTTRQYTWNSSLNVCRVSTGHELYSWMLPLFFVQLIIPFLSRSCLRIFFSMTRSSRCPGFTLFSKWRQVCFLALFHDAFNCSDHITMCDVMIGEQSDIWNEVKKSAME